MAWLMLQCRGIHHHELRARASTGAFDVQFLSSAKVLQLGSQVKRIALRHTSSRKFLQLKPMIEAAPT